MMLGLDHCEAGGVCKSEIGENGGAALQVFAAGCEANHTHLTALALVREAQRPHQSARIEPMKARRMAYWWFRFVVSGRFLEKFLKLRRP
ncbi:hypothetical protein [Bradyrhizobium sp. AZCC 1693]|uniref:hypothetical protein n=1 Tax=Bradyrhizobium sp. AZCC 1693 TaxID=3117029 RepID=UPI002FF423F6